MLKDFDKELDGIDEDSFLKEFEDTLGDDFDWEKLFSGEGTDENTSGEEQRAEGSEGNDFLADIDNIVSNVKNGNLTEGLEEGDLSIEESLKNLNEKDPDLDKIGQEFAIEDSFLTDSLEKESKASQEEESDSEKLAREIDELHLEEEDTTEDSKQKDFDAEQKNVKDVQDKPKKKGFFSRFAALLFGEEEEPAVKNPAASPAKDAEKANMSTEELDVLKQLENPVAAASQEEQKNVKEEAKKALKEKKAEEKAAKKAEKKALKEQRAKERAEKKALQKSQEPVERTKPLPKKPVVLIALFGASVVILVNLLSGFLGYRSSLAEAENYYDKGEYTEAYGSLAGSSMKDKDKAFYDKVKYTAYLQQQVKSYEVYQGQKMHEEALAALVCGVGRYDRFIEAAESAGVNREYEKMLQTIEKKLKGEYKMSLEQARKIYALEDRKEFTYAIGEALEGLGLEEEL